MDYQDPKENLAQLEYLERRETRVLRENLVMMSLAQRVKLEQMERKDQMGKMGIREQMEPLEKRAHKELLESPAMLENQEWVEVKERRVLTA